jgi:hypothetical protein
MLYLKGSQNAGTQRIQTATRSAKVQWIARTHTMAIRLPASSANTRRNKSNGNAKPAVTSHRRSTVLAEYSTQRIHWELGRTREPIRKKFSLNIQTPNVTGRYQVVCTEERQNSALLHTSLECSQKFCRTRLRQESNRCLFSQPSSFEPRGRSRENKAEDCHGNLETVAMGMA